MSVSVRSMSAGCGWADMPIVVLGGAAPSSTPPAPRLTAVHQRDGAAVAVWAAQGDGGSALIRFVVVTRRDSSGALVRVDQTSSAAVTSFTIQPLENDVTYRVSVQAVNMFGTSPESNVGLVTPSSTVVVPPPDEEEPPPPPPPPPVVVIPQPTMYAFPPERTFRAEHWLLTPEQADAL